MKKNTKKNITLLLSYVIIIILLLLCMSCRTESVVGKSPNKGNPQYKKQTNFLTEDEKEELFHLLETEVICLSYFDRYGENKLFDITFNTSLIKTKRGKIAKAPRVSVEGDVIVAWSPSKKDYIVISVEGIESYSICR